MPAATSVNTAWSGVTVNPLGTAVLITAVAVAAAPVLPIELVSVTL